jgi:hypothetical protein
MAQAKRGEVLAPITFTPDPKDVAGVLGGRAGRVFRRGYRPCAEARPASMGGAAGPAWSRLRPGVVRWYRGSAVVLSRRPSTAPAGAGQSHSGRCRNKHAGIGLAGLERDGHPS